jgi:hypothetical protein
MLERARLRTAEEGLHNVTFEHGDAQVHPFPLARFDVFGGGHERSHLRRSGGSIPGCGW